MPAGYGGNGCCAGFSALAFGGLAAPAARADGSGLGVTRDATIVPGASGGGTFSGLGSTYHPSRPQAEFTAPGSSAAGYAVSVAGMSTDGSVVLLNRNYSAVLDTTAFYAQPYIWTAQTGAVGLGFLPGTTWSNASAISGNGQAVVGNSWGASTYQAFRWTTATGTVGLGTLPGDTHSWANAVSADGSVVVGSSAGMNTTAFRWTAAAGMAGLGVLAGDTDSWATAVSADGSVVVGSSGHYDAYAWYAWAHYEQAFRWTAATGMIGLGILPGYVDSQATAVSADGSVVAGDSYSDSIWTLHQQAFRWTAATGMVGLGYLPGDTDSWVNGMSADGSVIVGASQGNFTSQAFRWTVATGMAGLGFLPGDTNSEAYAVSGNGLVVVGSSWHDWSVNSHAFRWTTATGMQSVADWLAANGRPVTGWTLERATAVNWNGSVVAGDGTDPNGNAQAWIARINGDTSAGLLGLDDAANSLASTINIPRMGTTLANMALHGAHGHPGEARLVSGKFCTWVNGDWGHSDVYNSNAGLLEAGLCATPFDGYGDPQFGLGIGKTWGSQTLPYNGNVEADGWYVVGDIDVHVGHSPIWATLTGLYGQTDSQVRRGYDNAGSRDSSKGTLPQQALAVRLRGEAREVWHKGPVAVTPYVDFAVIGTRANGYTESGGGFPASFNGRNDTVYDLRYGVIATYALSAKTRFIGDLGGVHWFNGNTPGVTGDVLGLFDFHLPGSSVSNDWVRVTAGIDQKIGPGVAYANITAASRGEDPTYMLAAGFRFAW